MKKWIVILFMILLLSTNIFAQMGPGHSFPPNISFTYGDFTHKIIFFNYSQTNTKVTFYFATNNVTVGPFDIEVRANSNYTFNSNNYSISEGGHPITHIIPWNRGYDGKVNFPRRMTSLGTVASPWQGYNLVNAASNIPPYGQNTPTITILNNTGYTISNVYVKPSSTYNWGEDKLGTNILNDAYYLPVRLPYPLGITNKYDIRLRDSDGDTYTKSNVTITANARIIFTFDDIDW